ncbi:MAG: hypothetical protein HYV97_14775 [Bdellovibrio sp.]|nr:hypothetical protein [Bdellovibrio sp.]
MDQATVNIKTPARISRKKLIAVSVVLSVIMAILILSVLVEMEAPPKKEVLYSEGLRHALIIYHPTWKYHFQEDLTFAFARGLNSSGWAVDRITTSSKHLVDFQKYDLYVFGTNTYYWNPDRPTKEFLSEIDLGQKPAVGLVSGPGYTERSEVITKELIGKANPSFVAIHGFSLLRPNKQSLIPDTNRPYAIYQAFQLGQVVGKEILKTPSSLRPQVAPN